jgi:hypothetical protein
VIKARSGRLIRRSLRAGAEVRSDLWQQIAAAGRPPSTPPDDPRSTTAS